MVRTYLTQDDLAQILHVSKRTLQNRLSKYPESLPTAIKMPGAKAPLWDPLSVEAWQNSMGAAGSSYTRANLSIIVAPQKMEKRRRGRPSNAERAKAGTLGASV
jgi:hypothetical protein